MVDAKIVDEVDLSGASVPAGELDFEVLDPDDRLNPLNPDGIYAYMFEGIPVHVDCITESETFLAGIYYMTAWGRVWDGHRQNAGGKYRGNTDGKNV